MTKITLDKETFKALASDTRLDILKTLDGKHLGLNDIVKATNLNKATLHEHLTKLAEAGLIKRDERDGHKWVYYKLTWKGSSLLHPENAKIVVLFTTTFVALWVGIIQLVWYIKGTVTNIGYDLYKVGDESLLLGSGTNTTAPPSQISGLPDFLRDLLSKGHPSSDPWTPLGSHLNVIEDAAGNGALPPGEGGRFVVDQSEGVLQVVSQNPTYLYIAVGCFLVFTVVLCLSLWRLWENRAPKL